MIDPANITNYERSDRELEEFFLFSILVAGKTAKTMARSLQHFLVRNHHGLGDDGPFLNIRLLGRKETQEELRRAGVGCWRLKGAGFYDAACSGVDLRHASAGVLESIVAVGRKTARYFIAHSRRDAGVAVLDRHVLRYLNELGYDVPSTTPSSRRKYEEVEQIALTEAKKAGMTSAEWDLWVWRRGSGN